MSRLTQPGPDAGWRSSHASASATHCSASSADCHESNTTDGTRSSWRSSAAMPSSPEARASSRWVAAIVGRTSSSSAKARMLRWATAPERMSLTGCWSQCSTKTSIRRTNSNAEPAATLVTTPGSTRTAAVSAGGRDGGGPLDPAEPKTALSARTGRRTPSPPQTRPRVSSRSTAAPRSPGSTPSPAKSSFSKLESPLTRPATQSSKAFSWSTAAATE